MRPRRLILQAGLAALATPFAAPGLGRAQANWPDRPVRFIVPFAPGGSTDILARVLASHYGSAFGQPFVVENRPGASGSVGSEFVARAAPDGYTMLMGHVGTLSVNPSLRQLNYDAETAFAPVAMAATLPNLLVVNPNRLPAVTDVAGLVAQAKANPGQLAYGSSGPGSISHMAMAAFCYATGTEMLQVPYRGTGPMVTDLVAGQTHVTMIGVPALLPNVRAGALRALGISGATRLAALPEVPTVAEAIGQPDFDASQWQGVVLPAGSPPAIIAALHRETGRAFEAPDARRRLADEGGEPGRLSPEEFGAFIKAEIRRWAALIQAANIKAD
jgi:tripartite-type tricarboxylate transporter receptor subunit TctC